jgi:nucleotide-binding universal stress UspA family protein
MTDAETQGSTVNFVVGVDFAETGDHAIAEALRMAKRSPGAEIHLVHVLPKDPWIKEDGLVRSFEAIEQAYQRLRQTVLKVAGVPTDSWEQQVSFHVRIGDAADALHQVAVDVDADLVIVGTHGRRGVEKLLLGSVASKLVQNARLPVLIARPKDFEGLEKTERPLPPKEGVDFHARRYDMTGHSWRETLRFGAAPNRVSGLI